ncbi:hypothetical protein CIHG_07490 [Coccidioides immitis H538.4]|uniref:Uncharacterized protein n=1 Tax=Coccidioides immitis H538.4 TaxID=396776 RepID=A0A0J8UQ94_COCIT|nr:hypothetical protein CIHG_07490 [Coccidioides immitis H538.4]
MPPIHIETLVPSKALEICLRIGGFGSQPDTRSPTYRRIIQLVLFKDYNAMQYGKGPWNVKEGDGKPPGRSLIRVFDPKAPDDAEPVWEWTKEVEYGTGRVPKECRVKVLHGWYKLHPKASHPEV